MKRALGLSLFLHALPLGLVVVWGERHFRAAPQPLPALEVRLSSGSAAGSPGASARTHFSTRKPRAASGDPQKSEVLAQAPSSLPRLFQIPGLHPNGFPTGDAEVTANAGSGGVAHGTDSVTRQRLAGGSGAGEIYRALPATQWLSALYERVDKNLIYPQELSNAGIQGDVKLEIRFGLAGASRPEITRIQSTSPYLRVAVMRTLNRIFQAPLSGDLQRVPPSKKVTAHFTFAIVESNGSVGRNLRAGETFLFHRQVVKSSLEWRLGPFSGTFLAPQVGVDPSWFLEKADRLRQRTKPDLLEPYRRDPEFKES